MPLRDRSCNCETKTRSTAYSIAGRIESCESSKYLPGSMKRVFAPIFLIHSRIRLAVNSGPLSDLMYSGTPRRTINSVSVANTSSDRSLGATLIARHSLLHSSITVSSLMGLPEYVRQATKSYAQTWFTCSGLSLVIKLSHSQSRPRPGCFFGTLSPSRLHMRSTLLWFTCHPSSFSSAVILRYPYLPNAGREIDDVGLQGFFIVPDHWNMTLCGSRLRENTAGPSLRDFRVNLLNAFYEHTATRRA